MRVNGEPLVARKVDAHTVVLTLPAPYGPGLRLLSGLPILPAHKLRDALARGEFAKAWSTSTPPAEIVGLGPYVLRSYTPGERIELARNPRYGARGPDVHPEVERLTLRVIPSQDAERLALEAGELDIMNSDIRPDDLKAMRGLEAAGQAASLRTGSGGRPGRALVQSRPRRPQAGRGPSVARSRRATRRRPRGRSRGLRQHGLSRRRRPGRRAGPAGQSHLALGQAAALRPRRPARPPAADRRRPEGRQRRRHLRDVHGQAAGHRDSSRSEATPSANAAPRSSPPI